MDNNTKVNITLTFSQLKELWLHPDDPDIINDILQPILNEKIQKIMRRELYTRYKTADTPEEREQARHLYLDEVGVPQDYRL